MPVRKIPLSHSSVTGHVNLGGGSRSISFESRLEGDFILQMAFDPDVIEIEEQPVAISYTHQGKQRTYTPDFLVTRKSTRPLLVEVKPSKFVNSDLAPKVRAGEQFARKNGWVFEVWTENEIKGPRLNNAAFLLTFRDQPIRRDAADALLAQLSSHGPQSISEITNALWPDRETRARYLPTLWSLIASGEIVSDFSKEITPASHIWLGTGAAYG